MKIVRIKFSNVPVPLNERLTVVPLDAEALRGGAHFVSGMRRAGKKRVTHVMRLTYKYSQWNNICLQCKRNYTKRENKIPPFKGSCVAVLLFTPPLDNKPHDSDGVVKGPFDVLTRSQIIKDDSQIKAFTVLESAPKGKGGMTMFLGADYGTNDIAAHLDLLKTVLSEK